MRIQRDRPRPRPRFLAAHEPRRLHRPRGPHRHGRTRLRRLHPPGCGREVRPAFWPRPLLPESRDDRRHGRQQRMRAARDRLGAHLRQHRFPRLRGRAGAPLHGYDRPRRHPQRRAGARLPHRLEPGSHPHAARSLQAPGLRLLPRAPHPRGRAQPRRHARGHRGHPRPHPVHHRAPRAAARRARARCPRLSLHD